MNWNNHGRLQRLAKEHAEAGLSLVEESLISELGPKPIFDPARDPRDRAAVQAVNTPRIEELQDDLSRQRAELTRHVSRTALMVGLSLSFAGEIVGAVLVLRALGFENPERLVLGVSLAFLAFFLTYQCVHFGRATPEAAGKRVGGTPKRSPWFLVLVGIYGALVLAIATVRSGDARPGEDASRASEWANVLIMVACSVGPAWLGEHFLRRLAPVSPLAREVSRLRKELRRLERDREWAERHIESRRRSGEEWDRKAAQARALYSRVHALRRAERARAPVRASAPEKDSPAS